MQKSYMNLAKYYDLMYQKKDYESEASFVLDLVDKYSIGKKSMLDVGCGTGAHLSFFKNDFEKVYGIDKNVEILEVAKKKIPKGIFSNKDMQTFSIKDKFDLITSLYAVINYNQTLEDLTKTISNIYKHLKDNGLFIFSLCNIKNLDKEMSMHLGHEENIKVAKLNQFKYFPDKKTLVSDYLVFVNDSGEVSFDIEIGDTFRIFDFEEIKKCLNDSGFKEYEIYNGFSTEIADQNSRSPLIVAHK